MKLHHLAATALLALSMGAQAASINAADATFAGHVVTFDGFDGLITAGPLDLGNGITFTSAPNAVVGADNQDLGDNGAWTAVGLDSPRSGNFLASAFVARRGEFGFTFANPVASVGAFVNQFQATGSTSNSLTLIAYDYWGNDLETFSVKIDTASDSYDQGRFVGFTRASADIYGFGIADGTVVVDNLVTAVPEASSWALALAGLSVAGVMARRRRAA